MSRIAACLLVCSLLVAPAFAQNLLTNPGFEAGNFTGWGAFGNAYVEPAGGVIVPNSGAFDCKMFGNFSGGFDVTGIFQTFAALPGQTFEMDCFSYNPSADALSGNGLPNDNWCVMKIAFFDGGNVEIGASEAVILDGTFPLDTWIDNAPIQGTAPAGTTSVQALVLYLQPANAGGAAQFDDIYFANTTALLFPGSGDDIELSTSTTPSGASSLNAATTGGGADIKTGNAGDYLTLSIASPMGTLNGAPLILGVDSFATGGSAPAGLAPNIYLGLSVQILIDGTSGALGLAGVVAPGGTSYNFLLPASLSGTTLIFQGAAFGGSALNGLFGTTEAHRIVVN